MTMRKKSISESRKTVVYGPVTSWRLGRSLGIDLISTQKKGCTFDCVYCQLGKSTHRVTERRVFVPACEVLAQVEALRDCIADYYTFSGMGEPTLAANIGEVIQKIKSVSPVPVAVLTNSSLISKAEVRDELSFADYVIAKLDGACEETFGKVNRPSKGFTLQGIIEGLIEFKKIFKGRLAIQTMVTEENAGEVRAMAAVVKKIGPHEIQINTPFRPCKVKPLERDEIYALKNAFQGINVLTVYDRERRTPHEPLSLEETLRRRPAL
ncbi:MAG: radical SAM protein [Candidatus Eremiobacteraeota bacterium]|nr:radical SAM protein [Candidatus Eremiobacteraeota bacterium]